MQWGGGVGVFLYKAVHRIEDWLCNTSVHGRDRYGWGGGGGGGGGGVLVWESSQLSSSSGWCWSSSLTCVKGKWPCLPLHSPSHWPLTLILVTVTLSPTCKEEEQRSVAYSHTPKERSVVHSHTPKERSVVHSHTQSQWTSLWAPKPIRCLNTLKYTIHAAGVVLL